MCDVGVDGVVVGEFEFRDVVVAVVDRVVDVWEDVVSDCVECGGGDFGDDGVDVIFRVYGYGVGGDEDGGGGEIWRWRGGGVTRELKVEELEWD